MDRGQSHHRGFSHHIAEAAGFSLLYRGLHHIGGHRASRQRHRVEARAARRKRVEELGRRRWHRVVMCVGAVLFAIGFPFPPAFGAALVCWVVVAVAAHVHPARAPRRVEPSNVVHASHRNAGGWAAYYAELNEPAPQLVPQPAARRESRASKVAWYWNSPRVRRLTGRRRV